MQNQAVIDNLLINYYIFKSQGKKTILFLHGWRSEGMIWKDIADKLDANLKLISLDLPGFGLSRLSKKAFSVSDYAEVVAHFIKKINLENVILVGHSFGGRIGIKLASSYPELLEKLVLVDSAGLILDQKKIERQRKLAKFAKPFFRPKFMQGLRKAIYKRIGSEDYLATPEIQETYKKVIGEDLRPDLSKIKVETLLFWGADDKETPIQYAEIMNKEIKNSQKVIVREAGHFSFLDQPQEFAETLKDFIK